MVHGCKQTTVVDAQVVVVVVVGKPKETSFAVAVAAAAAYMLGVANKALFAEGTSASGIRGIAWELTLHQTENYYCFHLVIHCPGTFVGVVAERP